MERLRPEEMRYAVISLERRTGTASTVFIHADASMAQKQAGRLELNNPEFRYTVLPFLGFHDTKLGFHNTEEKNDLE